MDKITNTVKQYIDYELMVCLYDCSDSSEQADKYKNRFEALTDDKIDIVKYINENLLEYYINKATEIIKQYGNYEIVKDLEDSVPTRLPIDDDNTLKRIIEKLHE